MSPYIGGRLNCWPSYFLKGDDAVYWEKIKDSKIYEVNNKGSVRNVKTGTIVKHGISGSGRHRVTLYEDGMRKTSYVDDLMADAFFEGDRNGRRIIYADGNPNNLDITNLSIRKETRKRVLEVVSGRIFDSRVECCDIMNVPSGVLSRCLSGKAKSYKGMSFVEID